MYAHCQHKFHRVKISRFTVPYVGVIYFHYLAKSNLSLSLSRSTNGEDSSSETTKAITDGTTEAQSSSTQDPAQSQGGGASLPGGTPHDSDKQERIERYVRMSISSQVEQQLLTQQNRQVCLSP